MIDLTRSTDSQPPTPPAPMRVAIFSETFRPAVNGIATRLDRTLEHLARRGDEVMVIVPGAGTPQTGPTLVRGLGGFRLPLYPQLEVALPRPAIRRFLTTFQPQLIHVVNPALLGLAGLHYARALEVPLIASFHTHLPKYLRHYGLAAMEAIAWGLLRRVHNRADLNLCLSGAMATELRSHGVERTVVGWRGGVDVEAFHPGMANPDMRARLSGGHPSAPVLLYVGRLGMEKQVERLRHVIGGIPDARLAIVGDGPHREALERHFAGTRTVFTGCLTGAELAAAYASADVFVFSSLTETMGLVLLEAMASGCPPVAANAGGIPEVVEDGVTGCLFDPADLDGALRATRRLLESERGRRLMGLRARAHALSWSWEAATDDLRGHYASLVGEEVLALGA